MRKVLAGVFLAMFAVSLGAGVAAAHSGGTNSDGCHNDRKRGTYHCH
ncbi:hypothetical protein PsAD13_04241 [Pseudovibrio sp. Ad13]|nr:hypothetical protein PsAD13_04241 [Pseudovibrio sp. Ad13]